MKASPVRAVVLGIPLCLVGFVILWPLVKHTLAWLDSMPFIILLLSGLAISIATGVGWFAFILLLWVASLLIRRLQRRH